MNAKRRTQSLTSLALGAAMVAGLQVGAAAPAQAAGPKQPRQVEFTNYGTRATFTHVTLTVGYPKKVSRTAWESTVQVCARGAEPVAIGPDTFSYTVADGDTRIYQPSAGETGKGLANQWLPAGKCTSGTITATGREPLMTSFHDLASNERVDILPATEWDGIPKVGWPRSAGTSNYYGDFTNDKVADVVGLSKGEGITYRTVSGPVLWTLGKPGLKGLNYPYTWIGKSPDMDHNGASEILARDTSGTLWQHRMMGNNRAGFPTIIGYGFNDARLMSAVNDVNGDGYAELFSVRSDGRLMRQAVKPIRVSSPVQVGRNWQGIKHILSVGDFSGDGRADLLAVTQDGKLMRYTLSSSGTVVATRQVGHGWNSMTKVVSPGDLNRDGRRDMVAVRSDGHLYFYANLGAGRWAPAKKIGTNWNGIQAIA
ncbi:FG-GAP repeat domain-containing protein [Luteococcus sp. Sow4_B9]|uniref:FG-GAP repeat domain-containing protein n=1 Tax=Luteococcus sp. Sow4_B9 TaxID=3438792 RepID=UPI003F963AA2